MKLNAFKIFLDFPKKSIIFPGSLEFHNISRFPAWMATPEIKWNDPLDMILKENRNNGSRLKKKKI